MKSLGSMLVLLSTLAGCSASFRYNTNSVAPLSFQPTRRIVAGPIDARDHGHAKPESSILEHPLKDEVAELREALTDQVVRAGLVSTADEVAATPTTTAEVEEILSRARSTGTTEVVFLRHVLATGTGIRVSAIAVAWLGLLPWIIFDSLPLSRHGAGAGFEAIVVDPQTSQVLLRTTRLAGFGERVTAWGHDPYRLMRDMLRLSAQAVLEDVQRAEAAGFPARTTVPELAKFVLSTPTVYAEGGRLRGPGWSLRPPPGWISAAQPASPFISEEFVQFALQSPDGLVNLSATMEPALGNPAETLRVAAANSPKLQPAKLGDVDALGAGPPLLPGLRRWAELGGMRFSIVCDGTPAALERYGAQCAEAFDTVAFDVLQPGK